MESGNVLEIKNLKVRFDTENGSVQAVDGLDLQIHAGESVGIVGESGSGKSISALSILRLVPDPPGHIEDGEILYRGRNLLDLPERDMQRIRGNRISMIFQEPITSLNPVLTIRRQMTEGLMVHKNLSRREAGLEAAKLLAMVGISDAEERLDHYPHQFSGGMLQRILIAMGMACQPEVLIADEPTTALDVTVQAQIMELLDSMRREYGTSLIIITHNLGLVARYVDWVNVMYAGRVVESAPVKELFEHPLHPYTIGLLRSIPRLDAESGAPLHGIPGRVVNVLPGYQGCRFAERCGHVKPECREQCPELAEILPGHFCACLREAVPAEEKDSAGQKR